MTRWREARAAWERLTAGAGDALESLADVGAVRRALDEAELEAVRAARRAGRSWAEIATRLGVTRQSAWERWRELDEEPVSTPGETLDAAVTAVYGSATPAQGPPARGRKETAPAVLVPDLLGLTWGRAVQLLRGAGLEPRNADPEQLIPGSRAQEWVVADQKPAAGEPAAGGVVTLWLRRRGGEAGQPAPLVPRPDPLARRGAIDETTGQSVP